jgi:hypothetical protein
MSNLLTEVLISIEDDHLDRFSDVVASLRAAGMDVKRSLELLGTITGTVATDKVDVLSKIDGVAAVERSREVFQV